MKKKMIIMNSYRVLALGSLLVAFGAVAEDGRFKPLSCLASKESKEVLAHMFKTDPSDLPQYMRDYCDEDSLNKNKEKCEKLIIRLYNKIAGKEREFTKVHKVSEYLGEKPENCNAKYQDPIQCAKCFAATHPKDSKLDTTSGLAYLRACSR